MKSLRRVFALLFGLSATVSRRNYLVAGVLLMALKLVVDNTIAYVATRHFWPIAAYLAPSVTLKKELAPGGMGGPAPEWMLISMAVVALPFIWIGVTMSVRRAADAGKSPFLGMLFLVPIVNYFVMIILASLRSAESGAQWTPPTPVYRASAREQAPPDSLPRRPMDPAVRATLLGMLSSITIGISMIGISIYSMELYGAALFVGTPFLMGVITAFAYNRPQPRSLAASVFMALLSIIITGSVVLLFAVEGLICLVMAFPIAGALAALGGILGWAVAQQRGTRPGHAVASVLFLPGLAGAEHQLAAPELHEVATTIEIDAPPERVWPNVIGFSELPPPRAIEAYFRMGIAYPVRARIQGEGVGAVRHCEFSTGPFVEPITAWEPPRHLAFDVSAQPPSMTELSPWKNVKAAHLEGYMVSRRGEFRLIALPGERTRLEGSTWYTLSIYPESYWTVWGEALLHAIHGRVLGHIKTLSEARVSDDVRHR